jgi:hypothetical protein
MGMTATGTTQSGDWGGDWTCVQCLNVNWARRTNCNKCDLNRPAENVTKKVEEYLQECANSAELAEFHRRVEQGLRLREREIPFAPDSGDAEKTDLPLSLPEMGVKYQEIQNDAATETLAAQADRFRARSNINTAVDVRTFQDLLLGSFPVQMEQADTDTSTAAQAGSTIPFPKLDNQYVEGNEQYAKFWKKLTDALKESWKEAESVAGLPQPVQPTSIERVQQYHKQVEEASQLLFEQLSAFFGPSPQSDLLDQCGLWISRGKYAVICKCFGILCSAETAGLSHENTDLVQHATAFLVSVKHMQHAKRLLAMLAAGQAVQLRKELKGGIDMAWDPAEFPDFLAFEIDNDVTIRAQQAKVAIELLGDKTNRLLQLNMGEGKTAIIMPIVLCAASRGLSRALVRGTVLPSLYSTNAKEWQWKVGGLLGRRIHPLLCRRAMQFTEIELQKILRLCRKVRADGDIFVLTQEHRMSLENKAIELAAKSSHHFSPPRAAIVHQVLFEFSRFGRDFLDESDALLSATNQQVYTFGPQADFDGATRRWKIHAAVLLSVCEHARTMQEKFGVETVEISTPNCDKTNRLLQLKMGEGTHCFPGVRLIETAPRLAEAIKWLSEKVIHDFESPPEGSQLHRDLQLTLTPDEKVIWKSCVMGEIIDSTSIAGREFLQFEEKDQESGLTLRGLLSHGVMQAVLCQRWRVQFGSHPNRRNYQLAVPYRAKDVAAAKVEFGHADMLLGLTFRHYLCAGLTEAQFRDVFLRLKKLSKSERSATWRAWVERCDDKCDLSGMDTFDGVNIEDKKAFAAVQGVFARHMDVINFWLIRMILPVQAKQFPETCVSTAWSLCRAPLHPSWKNVTSGFSGTEDEQYVLPETIEQKNLPELKLTNGLQLRLLLREENSRFYRAVSAEDSAANILSLLGEDVEFNVVLDAGALVLQLSNEDFARKWLEARQDKDAVVFYDATDTQVALCRNGSSADIVPFQSSCYCSDMSDALLYLDEYHTRGSDFRLPIRSRAVLTLGKGMGKAKLMQACIRMRQLGQGQSVGFVASPEVDSLLQRFYGLPATTEELVASNMVVVTSVLRWALVNTMQRVYMLIPHLANQGRMALQKAVAYCKCFPEDENDCPEQRAMQLATACVKPERLKLRDMYLAPRHQAPLTIICATKLQWNSLAIACLETGSLPENRRDIFNTAMELQSRISMIADGVTVPSAQCDEEQECELEEELEELVDVERPPKAEPVSPEVSQELRWLLEPSRLNPLPQVNASFRNGLFSILHGTRMMLTAEECCDMNSLDRDGIQIYVSTDFRRTAKQQAGQDIYSSKSTAMLDNYLKRIQWLLLTEPSSSHSAYDIWVVSNFEAESFVAAGVHLGTPSDLQGSTRCVLIPFVSISCMGQDEDFLSIGNFGGSFQVTTMRDEKKPYAIYLGLHSYFTYTPYTGTYWTACPRRKHARQAEKNGDGHVAIPMPAASCREGGERVGHPVQCRPCEAPWFRTKERSRTHEAVLDSVSRGGTGCRDARSRCQHQSPSNAVQKFAHIADGGSDGIPRSFGGAANVKSR